MPKKNTKPSNHYMVGDLQGCLAPLKTLLKKVSFNPKHDQLWCVGDLVNRGPDSLETLRYLYSLGDAVRTVLGNHDLHLLAIHSGAKPLKKKDIPFLGPILEAKDADNLIYWLRSQPLIYVDHELKAVMAHAGIPHIWTMEQSIDLAREVEALLQSKKYAAFLSKMYGNTPSLWQNKLAGDDRHRCIVNYLTRMRFLNAQGHMEFDSKESPEDAPQGFFPWFTYEAKGQPYPIVFGHWAALMGHTERQDRIGLDTGCVWGNHMTLLHWETGRRYTAKL
jgi:bis(5'-nucleosyl)-tetraphosphatase (symmetrical)